MILAAPSPAPAGTITAGTGSNFSYTEGTAGENFLLATFTDSVSNQPPTSFLATINWGDGSSSGAAVVSLLSSFNVLGSHTYVDEGTFQPLVSIRSQDGTASVTDTATVADAPLTGTSALLPGLVEGTTVFAGPLGSFTDANPLAAASDFTETTNWGDGTTSTGTISATGGGQFSIDDAHLYADEGAYSVKVSVLDKGGSSLQFSDNAVVNDAPLSGQSVSFSTTDGALFNGTVATFHDVNTFALPSDFTATIHWGDGTVSGGIVTLSNGSFSVSGSHTYGAVGPFLVLANVTDDGGSTVGLVGLAEVAAPEPGAIVLVSAGLVVFGLFRGGRA